MGLHIHVSLNRDGDYYRIASKKFHDWFTDRVIDSELYDKNRRLRERIRNNKVNPRNRDITMGYFCKSISSSHTIDSQLRSRRSKYHRITYFKDKYDTVEFRLFPAMDNHNDVIEAVDLVTTSINKYLREKKYTEKLEDELKVDQEVKHINV